MEFLTKGWAGISDWKFQISERRGTTPRGAHAKSVKIFVRGLRGFKFGRFFIVLRLAVSMLTHRCAENQEVIYENSPAWLYTH